MQHSHPAKHPLLDFILFILLFPGLCSGEGLFLKTTVPIDDDFRGYCVDVARYGERIRLDDPLRMHTCKYRGGIEDQVFAWADDESGHITLLEYDRCLAADTLKEGAQLFVRECNGSTLQKWAITPNGRVKPASAADLCLTVASQRQYAGADSWIAMVYHARTLSLQTCSTSHQAYQQLRWGHPGEQTMAYADGQDRKMPAHIARAIADLGPRLGTITETGELYLDQARTYEPGELERHNDLAYGPHERHRLDVFTDKHRRSGTAMPVVVYFHGGGFVRGNREANRNVAEYFASLGLVGVNATYRLAPEIKWPEGARDVGAAITWVNNNITEYGGDPDQIIVIGKSAGAAHVASYVFRPELLPKGSAVAAGAVLISGDFYLTEDDAREGNLIYYGETLSDFPGMSVVGNISRSDMPVMLVISEYDPPFFAESMLKLAHALTLDHGKLPGLVQLKGHNHYSSNMSVGTQDTVLSAGILDFIHSIR